MQKRGWFFWLAVFSAAFLTLFAASFYFLFRSLRWTAPRVTEGSAVTVDLARWYPEAPLYELGGFFGLPELAFRDLLFGIEAAKTDSRIESLFLHVRGSQLGWAQASELRSQLVDFKSSEKPLIAFIEHASNRDYYLATAANEIYLHPQATLDLRGIRAELTFVHSTLQMLGIEAEFERIGTYKDAPEMFLRDSMSPESREATGDLVETIHWSLVEALAEGRGMSELEARRAIALGPLTGGEAEELGLVDGLEYHDQVKQRMAPEGEELETISIGNYRLATRRAPGIDARARIAVIYGIGMIVGGGSADDLVFGRIMGSDTIAEAFEKVTEDDSIDAVVFRIDSPGGSDVASDVIWRAAQLAREEKPVVVSMGNVAASGGYWVATASDAIVAEPTTITGSIGIYAGKFNLAGLYDKVGVSKDGVGTSANADFFSDSRSFSARERARLKKILEEGYQAFLERVAESRGMTTAEVDVIAQGRVWSGVRALEHGLVDELGGLGRAIALAKEKAGIDETAPVELRIYPEKRSVFEFLLSNLAVAREGKRSIRRSLLDSPVFQLLSNGQPLALMPFELRLD